MFTRDNAKEHGRKGGQTTAQRHGREHMKKIAKAGFRATTKKHFHGSEFTHIRFLQELGKWVYWKMTGLSPKYGPDGNPIWPIEKPVHPAHLDPKDNLPF